MSYNYSKDNENLFGKYFNVQIIKNKYYPNKYYKELIIMNYTL